MAKIPASPPSPPGPHRGGQEGNANAAKAANEKLTAVFTVRCLPSEKNMYVKKAGGKNLSLWMRTVLNKEAGHPPPDE